MDFSMQEMIKSLGLGMDDARVVGIWGMGGIGKTTLTSAIYAHISCQFEGCSFIENVREVSEKGGLKTLHERLISEILMEKDLKVGNIGSALSTIRNRVCLKKVHIVLDDVDESTKLEKLVAELDCMEEMIKLLGLGMDDARVMGIWGMGGIGKTALASAIYAHISCQFEGCSFIENVRQVLEKGALKTLHKQLISKILMEKDLKVGNIGSALSTIRNRVCHKKVHIVLDDVDESTELEKLVGELDWFGFGSRIIKTTRNQHTLIRYGITHIYKLDELGEDEAIELFKSKAIRKHQHMGRYGELVHCAVKHAKGVPLALKVLGSFLCSRNKD
ncbi:disease resistance protein CHL1-like [Camellia sinensis]|uniref:disease resistance protein CHL1-like n=1 Tax=Camellia sinensis TaxID=4442 RepID=UPI001036313D|nr:disease resistance protein CHL1-like [Camellia sinensis]